MCSSFQFPYPNQYLKGKAYFFFSEYSRFEYDIWSKYKYSNVIHKQIFIFSSSFPYPEVLNYKNLPKPNNSMIRIQRRIKWLGEERKGPLPPRLKKVKTGQIPFMKLNAIVI